MELGLISQEGDGNFPGRCDVRHKLYCRKLCTKCRDTWLSRVSFRYLGLIKKSWKDQACPPKKIQPHASPHSAVDLSLRFRLLRSRPHMHRGLVRLERKRGSTLRKKLDTTFPNRQTKSKDGAVVQNLFSLRLSLYKLSATQLIAVRCRYSTCRAIVMVSWLVIDVSPQVMLIGTVNGGSGRIDERVSSGGARVSAMLSGKCATSQCGGGWGSRLVCVPMKGYAYWSRGGWGTKWMERRPVCHWRWCLRS